MKKLLIGGMIAMMAAPAIAAPGNTATEPGQASATVVQPISITRDTRTELNFGVLTAGTGGTVIVAPDGTGTATGNVTRIPGVNTTADQFQIAGEPNRGFSIVTTPGTVSDGTNTMSFTTVSGLGASSILSASGTAALSVGGELTVSDAQAPGFYTGSYDVTVTYN